MKEIEFRIESVEHQTEVIQFLDDKVYEYNSSTINKFEGILFTKIIRDQNSNIIAGISGWTWAMVSEITLLWVKEEYRKNGLGKMLLKAAEDEIIKKGCTTILLRSYSFQAPLFYEKHGYKTVYILDDFPNGYKHYNLVKRIT
ncbi:MAG TPA: GNAT family N-acetyltransferase [Chitinophagaceae bacterium]|nr:GNAT family N-acetyltransferase [Chitinophagaceae bacterium]